MKNSMNLVKYTVVLMLLPLITACGFTPIYQDDLSTSKSDVALRNLDIVPILDQKLISDNTGGIQNSRLGQIMFNRLQQLTKAQGGGHQLSIHLSQKFMGFGMRPDASAAQEQVTLTAHINLIDPNLNSDEQKVLEIDISDRVAYDLVQSDFSNLIKREDSLKRLSVSLADRIHRQLILFYRD